MDNKAKVISISQEFKQYLENLQHTKQGEMRVIFKDILQFILRFSNEVVEYHKSIKPSRQREFRTASYLMQFTSCYELYTSSSMELCDMQRCLCKQLVMHLNNASVIFDESNLMANCFMELIDLVLNNLVKIDLDKETNVIINQLNSVAEALKEILCFSMAIAHISFGEDYKIISATCRLVLKNFEDIKTEINKETKDTNICNLVIDTFSNSLCLLETRVNSAVLRLCLNVFSEHKRPILSLEESTNDDTSEFDLYMDRLFQISIFAIASSSYNKRTAEIKNIASNLEFLEDELVPAIISKSHTKNIDVLKDLWYSQVKQLRKIIHNIIEPSAYTKLVYEELDKKIEQLWINVSHNNKLEKTAIESFIQYSKELILMLKEGEDVFDETIKENAERQAKVVENFHTELKASVDILLSGKTFDSSEEINRRIFKRCKLLTSSIKELWLCFNQNDLAVNKDQSTTEEVIDQVNLIKEDVFENILSKSKQLAKDRSMAILKQNTRILFKNEKF